MVLSDWQIEWLQKLQQAGLADFSTEARLQALERWAMDTGPRLQNIHIGLEELKKLEETTITQLMAALASLQEVKTSKS